MIKESAIKVGNAIFRGKRHNDCFRLAEAYLGREAFPLDEIQGFITDEGVFLDRIEALRHAIECGQITEGKYGDELYSEDLY